MLITRNYMGHWVTPHGTRVRLATGGKEFHIAFDFTEGQTLSFNTSSGARIEAIPDRDGWLDTVLHMNHGATPTVQGVPKALDSLEVEHTKVWGEFFRQVFITDKLRSTQWIEDTEIMKLDGINA